jgi:glycosyltransferase involved in cell wall biosynthesis
MKLALFDDYPHERGHHPDLLVGLAVAASARVYCPLQFLEGHASDEPLDHVEMVGARDGSADTTAQNLSFAYRDAANAGCQAVVNLFFDENWDSFPINTCGLPSVHVLHRPAELTGALGGVNAMKPMDPLTVLEALSLTDTFVVHTTAGEEQALQLLPQNAVVRIGWPSARQSEIRERFDHDWQLPDSEPYVLLLGEALDYKGIHFLLEALNPGPFLRIAGNLAVGDRQWLHQNYPSARVAWETGWITRSRMNSLIDGAAVIAFPYLQEFALHGGVSAALVHALSFAKPVVISEALVGQVPPWLVAATVPVDDIAALREELTRVVAASTEAHAQARANLDYMLAHHSYERHVNELVALIS